MVLPFAFILYNFFLFFLHHHFVFRLLVIVSSCLRQVFYVHVLSDICASVLYADLHITKRTLFGLMTPYSF